MYIFNQSEVTIVAVNETYTPEWENGNKLIAATRRNIQGEPILWISERRVIVDREGTIYLSDVLGDVDQCMGTSIPNIEEAFLNELEMEWADTGYPVSALELVIKSDNQTKSIIFSL